MNLSTLAALLTVAVAPGAVASAAAQTVPPGYPADYAATVAA